MQACRFRRRAEAHTDFAAPKRPNFGAAMQATEVELRQFPLLCRTRGIAQTHQAVPRPGRRTVQPLSEAASAITSSAKANCKHASGNSSRLAAVPAQIG